MKSRHGDRPPTYVSLILSNKVRVENPTGKALDAIDHLGGYEERVAGRQVWTIPFQGDEELADILKELNSQGAVFGGEPAGWPPAAVFRNLCMKGLLQKPFNEVTWTGSGKWIIREG